MQLKETARMMLEAAHRELGGDMNKTVSMWTIGEGIGLDRGGAEDTAMELVGEGLLEIKSLSGGVCLTDAGWALLGPSGTGTGPLDLGGLIGKLEDSLNASATTGSAKSDLELDIQLLKIQRDRSQPLPGVIKAGLTAIREALPQSGGVNEEVMDALSKFLSED